MNPKPLSIRRRAIVPVGIPVSSDERTLEIIPGASLKLWRGNEGRRAAHDCREAPATCRPRARLRRQLDRTPHAELESGASVGSSNREVKKASRGLGFLP